MTPDQLAAEALRLADRADHYIFGDGADPITGLGFAAEGIIHALLALRPAPQAPPVEVRPPLWVDGNGTIWTDVDGRPWAVDTDGGGWAPTTLLTIEEVADDYDGVRRILWPGEQP